MTHKEVYRALGTVLVFVAYFCSFVLAAPLKTPGSLPLTGEDLNSIRELLNSEGATQEFAYFIKGLDVFPDHQNPSAISQIEDRRIRKVFFIAPFFQASEERSTVGTQELADEGLKIISEIYELVTSFDFELFKINQCYQERNTKLSALEKLSKNISNSNDQLSVETSKQLMSQLRAEVSSLQSQIDELEAKADRGIDETSIGLRKQVVNQIQLKLSMLGLTATQDEEEKLRGSSVREMREGIASLLARATGLGQFGYRTATFEAGYTEQQKDWIALYKRIRPDVQVTSLPANRVYVRGTAMTAKSDAKTDAPYFLGTDRVITAPRLYLAINGGSNGACGSTRSCNVVIEYTWLGATMAKVSRTGAVTMPVYFEADVSFIQPDFEGSITCDFTNGFRVEGRTDVKDGAVIYDGDVYNRINYSALEAGACKYSIVKGDGDSGAYYAIKHLYNIYMNLKMQRAAKSRLEMDEYREFVNRELNYHASRAQNTNYDFWSLTTWVSAFGQPWGTIASFAVGGARGFYWHTRVEDSTVTESIKFTTSISESNVQKTERIAFDGFPVLCWKKDGYDRFLGACPSSKLADYRAKSDTDLGKSQSVCGSKLPGRSCSDSAENSTKNLTIDENGVILDPWA